MSVLMLQSEVSDLSQEDSPFSKLCTLLIKDLEQKRTIRERTLLDFSKQIVQILSQGSVLELPSSFFMLAEYADDYFRYDYGDESDLRRGSSYARVFQLTQLLNIRETEQEKEITLFQDIEQNRKNAKLFDLVSKTPWITHKELCVALGISAPALTQRIAPLETAGYLTSQRLGKRKHYFLTDMGASLHQKLSPKSTAADLSRHWSPSKTQLLYVLLVSYSSCGNTLTSSPIINCVKVIDRLSDAKAEDFLLQFKSTWTQPNSVTNTVSFSSSFSSVPASPSVNSAVVNSQREYFAKHNYYEKKSLSCKRNFLGGTIDAQQYRQYGICQRIP